MALKISMTISLCVYVFMCMRSLEFIFGYSFETREWLIYYEHIISAQLTRLNSFTILRMFRRMYDVAV